MSTVAAAVVFRLVFLGNMELVAWIRFVVKYGLVIGVAFLVLGFTVQFVRGSKRAVQILSSAAGLICVTVLALVVAEFGVRFAYRDVTTTADNESYFSDRWHENVRYNSLGFREREFDTDKSPGTYRIAVIGDSFAYGQGIEEQERFSNLLENWLNEQSADREYEVLNFARPGYETLDEIDVLEKTVLRINPDFVLLQWYINDVQGHESEKYEAGQSLNLVPHRLRRRSALFYLIHEQIARFTSPGTSFDDYQVAEFGDEQSPASVAAKGTLQAFVRACKNRGIAVGIVVFSESYFRETPLDFLADRVLALCEEESIPCVDMRGKLLEYKEGRKLWASRLDPHPSAFANKLTAE
ncbi:MAG TPA: SGNH/GDSL hydrolase family protein, partial [Gammaproteobacteria bacterium]|nr:SGNH/GDSL hydrolase family protein [Gammaproteobacteria bacterium]